MKVLNLLLGGNIGGIEELCKNISIYANYDNTFCFLFYEGVIYDEMKKEGAKTVSLANKSRYKWSLQRLAYLYKLAKAHDIIVVHHCAKGTYLYYIFLAFMLKSKKKVMTLHSCFEEKHNYPHKLKIANLPEKILMNLALRVSDRVIFVSNAGKNSYIYRFDIDEKKIRVVYNGINKNLKYPREKELKHYDENDCQNIVFIGRLTAVKGVDLLIDAINKLIKEDKAIKLRVKLVGDGDQRKYLEKMVCDYKLFDYISFEGMQRDRDKYLSNADIFVYPSIWQEVFGISIVEAMAYGVPCIGFKVGGIPEIIRNGENGIIAEEISADCLADAIQKIIEINKTDNIYIMRRKCMETAESFSIDKTVARLRNIYTELLNEKNG